MTPKKHRRAAIPAVFAAALLFAAYVRWENHALQTTRFDLCLPGLPAGFEGCRIAVLSDLHGAQFGEDNQKLLQHLAAEKPEYIFYLGDLEDRFRGVQEGYAARTAALLAAVAPTYYVTGNHEWANGNVRELKETLRQKGLTVLDNTFVTLERNSDTMFLAGIDDPNGYADQKTPEALAEEIAAAGEDPFWLLLAHRGNLFPMRYSLLGADLVLSGHGHGGVWRLPFTDGLIGNDFKFFPSYMAGLYEENGSMLFATRGLGNSGRSFRLFNRPEIAVLTLHSTKG